VHGRELGGWCVCAGGGVHFRHGLRFLEEVPVTQKIGSKDRNTEHRHLKKGHPASVCRPRSRTGQRRICSQYNEVPENLKRKEAPNWVCVWGGGVVRRNVKQTHSVMPWSLLRQRDICKHTLPHTL
jgi:hypothetical protein